MSNFERPKIATCKECKGAIEWKDAPNNSGKRWPFDLNGTPHFQTCPNKKPFISKCKFCQQEIEWKDRKPMNKDGTNHLESCDKGNSGSKKFEDMDPIF